MSKPTDYILASAAETDRLRLQARVWQPAAEAMLDLIVRQRATPAIERGHPRTLIASPS